MSVELVIVGGPLGEAEPWGAEGAGAVVRFEGVVRPDERGEAIAALVYETYEPMTERELRKLGERIVAEHGLMAMRIEHSRGRVPVGARSFRLSVASAHRAEALRAMEVFIVEMKRGAPLWKVVEHAADRTGAAAS